MMAVVRAIAEVVARIADLTTRKLMMPKKTESLLLKKPRARETAEVTTTAEDVDLVTTEEEAVAVATVEVTAMVELPESRASTPITPSVITRARALRPLQARAMLEVSQLAVEEVDAVVTAGVVIEVATVAVTVEVTEVALKATMTTVSTEPLDAAVVTVVVEVPMPVPLPTASEHLFVQRVSWIEWACICRG
ncbi:MAG: hypothetical protein GY849_12935 [Deltaproteobacteria bacterium]|nr:hypothetical protein [Deltaproteobacteria bacterium]